MTMELLILSTDDFASLAADRIAREIADLAQSRKLLSLALSGGNTPGPVNRILAERADLPWDRVVVYFADERAVPPDHPESNYRMVRESLLDRLPVPPRAVHRMEAERENLDAAAAEYARLLPERLDLLLLGLGEDGHIASLFPQQTDAEDSRRVFPVMAPKPPPLRMTIGPRVVRADRTRRLMLVQGKAKANAVATACEGPWNPADCPGQLAREALWILDRPAASRLERARA
ncbi:MAG TPA: 6-phosphogluconolactonase [Gemmatimonadales bacterium]|nr:6-phosphogluconolactonase [Gemmatimonadales bacterium]